MVTNRAQIQLNFSPPGRANSPKVHTCVALKLTDYRISILTEGKKKSKGVNVVLRQEIIRKHAPPRHAFRAFS